MSKRTLWLFVLSAMLLPAVSQAEMVNGDFDSGLDGWTTTPLESGAAITITSGIDGNLTNVAHLSTSADFTWTPVQNWTGESAFVDLKSDVFTSEPGDTAVTFKYLNHTQGEGVETYVGFYADSAGMMSYKPLPMAGTGWNTYTLELRDDGGNDLPPDSQLFVYIQMMAITPSYEFTDGQTHSVHVQSDLYLDNFTVVGAIPEPTTLLTLLLAGVGNAVYFRRRMAA